MSGNDYPELRSDLNRARSAEPTELDRCLTALRLEVPAAVADDVTRIVRAAIAEARREGAAEALEAARDDAHAMGAPKTVRDFLTARAAALRGDA